MSYYVHTLKSSKIVDKSLFKLNKISYEEMLENLLILLDGEKHQSTATVANLPTNEAVLLSLHGKPPLAKSKATENLVNSMCVVVWVDDGSYSWYLGYIKQHCEDQDSFEVDHLTRVIKSSDTKWKYPSTPDIQIVERDQIVKFDIRGQWDMDPDNRKRLFTVENHKEINYASKLHISAL